MVSLLGPERHSFSVPIDPARERFEIEGLYAGTWHVGLDLLIREDNGTSMTSGPRAELVVASGETETLRLGFEPFYTLSGTALLEDGRIPRVRRLLLTDALRNELKVREVIIADDGSFLFEKLATGSYDLVLSNYPEHVPDKNYFPFSHPNRRSVIIEDQDVTTILHFKALGNIFGRIVADRGDLEIALWENGHITKKYPVTPTGRFTIPEPGPGEHTLMLLGFLEGDPLHLLDVVVPDDGSDVDLGELYPESYATLHVTLAGGASLDSVHMWSMKPPRAGYDERDHYSRYTLLPGHDKTVRIPSGPMRFGLAPGPAGYRADPSVLAVPGETAEVTIALLPVTRLTVGNGAGQQPTRVTVTAADGTRYIAEGPIGARPIPDGSPQVWMGMVAAYFESLPAGTYAVSAEWPDTSFAREVTLIPGKPALLTETQTQ